MRHVIQTMHSCTHTVARKPLGLASHRRGQLLTCRVVIIARLKIHPTMGIYLPTDRVQQKALSLCSHEEGLKLSFKVKSQIQWLPAFLEIIPASILGPTTSLGPCPRALSSGSARLGLARLARPGSRSRAGATPSDFPLYTLYCLPPWLLPRFTNKDFQEDGLQNHEL